MKRLYCFTINIVTFFKLIFINFNIVMFINSHYDVYNQVNIAISAILVSEAKPT